MGLLWDRSGKPVRVRDLLDDLEDQVAYTTLMTVLSRLHEKGLLRRIRRGRAWAYTPSLDGATYTADAMQGQLQHAPDRQAALLKFVTGLPPEEVETLKRLLDDDPS